MWFELLILIIGIAFGFFSPGKQSLWGLLKKGLIVGIVLAVILGLIATFLVPGGFGLAVGFLGGIGIFIGIVILVIIFIVGVFIGDFLEGVFKKK
ncbi:MAG: hypothetical protein LUQ25_06005 [Methanoregulaceae archaeon]|nr:hypothetical protein [Methanoregulaceae archaeon]